MKKILITLAALFMFSGLAMAQDQACQSPSATQTLILTNTKNSLSKTYSSEADIAKLAKAMADANGVTVDKLIAFDKIEVYVSSDPTVDTVFITVYLKDCLVTAFPVTKTTWDTMVTSAGIEG